MGGNSIDGTKEPAKCDSALLNAGWGRGSRSRRMRIVDSRDTMHKGGIDILHECNGFQWHLRNHFVELVVVESLLSQRDHVNVQAKFASDALDETGLSGARGTMLSRSSGRPRNSPCPPGTYKEVTTTERNPTLAVPGLR